MRFYHYLSERKVEMLYGQIADPETATSSEVGADVKVFKIGFKRERPAAAPNFYKKLEAVERWIYANEPVGSIDEPEAWISGRIQLSAVMAAFNSFKPSDSEGTDGQLPVLIGGRTDRGSTLMLGGSQRHLTHGDSFPVQHERGFSSRSALTEFLSRHPGVWDAVWPTSDFMDQKVLEPKQAEEGPGFPDAWLTQSIVNVVGNAVAVRTDETPHFDQGSIFHVPDDGSFREPYWGLPLGECEFLAKTYMVDPRSNTVIGTPLFVALMD